MVNYIGTDASFARVLEESANVVIMFTATWCRPCKAVSAKFERISQTMNQFLFFKVDVNDMEKVTDKYGINNVPMICYFKDGILHKKMSGSHFNKVKKYLEAQYNLAVAGEPQRVAPDSNADGAHGHSSSAKPQPIEAVNAIQQPQMKHFGENSWSFQESPDITNYNLKNLLEVFHQLDIKSDPQFSRNEATASESDLSEELELTVNSLEEENDKAQSPTQEENTTTPHSAGEDKA